MIISGIAFNRLFILNCSGYIAGLERASAYNIADGYVDDAYFVAMNAPGLVRVDSMDNLRIAGNGLDTSTKYTFVGISSIKITELGEFYTYDVYSSQHENYRDNNLIFKRYTGHTDNNQFHMFTFSPKSQVVINNAMNMIVLGKITEFDELVKYLTTHSSLDRIVSDHKTLYSIDISVLKSTIAEVNAAIITPFEAAGKWEVRNCSGYNNINRMTIDDVAEFTFENVGMWQHYLL